MLPPTSGGIGRLPNRRHFLIALNCILHESSLPSLSLCVQLEKIPPHPRKLTRATVGESLTYAKYDETIVVVLSCGVGNSQLKAERKYSPDSQRLYGARLGMGSQSIQLQRAVRFGGEQHSPCDC